MALHTSTFCYNGSFPVIRNFQGSFPVIRNQIGAPCPRIGSFDTFPPVSSVLPKQYNIGFPKAFRGGYGFLLPSDLRHISLRNENFRTFKQISGSGMRSFRPCQLKSESSSGESTALDAQTLEQDLQSAIADEDYARAAQIRDSLKALHEDSKTSVLAANAKFYELFRTGDLAAMQELWARGENVCCVHPGTSGISGYDDVMTSWEYVWANYEFPLEIQLKEVKVHARGDVGYVTCVELVKTKGSSWGGQFVTNVFERINGKWFICIHHASPIDL